MYQVVGEGSSATPDNGNAAESIRSIVSNQFIFGGLTCAIIGAAQVK